MLYEAVQKAPEPGVDPEIIERYYKNFDDRFFLLCIEEMKKIDTFYSGIRAEMTSIQYL